MKQRYEYEVTFVTEVDTGLLMRLDDDGWELLTVVPVVKDGNTTGFWHYFRKPVS